MECSAIKLINRKEAKKHNKITYRRKCEERPAFSADFCHRSFIQSKQQSENKSLNTTILQLPSNVKMFNTGASLDKWSQKRPRLKSTKKIYKTEDDTEESPHVISNEETQEENAIKSSEIETAKIEDPFEKFNIQSENYETNEIDSDVEKLITQFTNKPEERTNKRQKRRRKRHVFNKNKDEKHNKIKRKGKVKYSITKPPSPSTLEVIRVNVTSNYYSIDHTNSDHEDDDNNDKNDCTRGHGSKIKCSFVLQTNKFYEDEEEKNFEVECKKLVLGCRKSADKSKSIT